jgi:hypothetical protein
MNPVLCSIVEYGVLFVRGLLIPIAKNKSIFLGKYISNMKTRRQRRKLLTIRKSRNPDKKYDAVFQYSDGHTKTVPFGSTPYSDFTKHRDVTRRARYLKRHSGMGEHWQKPDTPGALSRWILWHKPTLRASVADFKKRFDL